jgi:hypothetical protein
MNASADDKHSDPFFAGAYSANSGLQNEGHGRNCGVVEVRKSDRFGGDVD